MLFTFRISFCCIYLWASPIILFRDACEFWFLKLQDLKYCVFRDKLVESLFVLQFFADVGFYEVFQLVFP